MLHLFFRMLEAAVNHLRESSVSLTELRDHIKNELQSQYLEKQESLRKQEMQLTGKLTFSTPRNIPVKV